MGEMGGGGAGVLGVRLLGIKDGGEEWGWGGG